MEEDRIKKIIYETVALAVNATKSENSGLYSSLRADMAVLNAEMKNRRHDDERRQDSNERVEEKSNTRISSLELWRATVRGQSGIIAGVVSVLISLGFFLLSKL